MTGFLMKSAGLLLASAFLAGAADVPGVDSIQRYCDDGGTGGGSGVRLNADDALVEQRRRSAAAPVEETTRKVPAGSYARVAALLEAAGFQRLSNGSPSNTNCSLEWKVGDVIYSVSWGGSRAPAELQPALDELQAVAKTAR